MQVVWFKRDLRVWDNRALSQAALRGPVLPLYVVEPELWQQPDMSARHWAFIEECLKALRAELAQFGQPLVVRTGRITDVLHEVLSARQISGLWSHEETGNGWTYARDIQVADWCRAHGISWHELRNHGVIRRLGSRSGWAKRWDSLMAEREAKPPNLEPLDIPIGAIPDYTSLGLSGDHCSDRQRGGRADGLRHLESFLQTRGRTYRRDMSSPLRGAQTCSRLSPHLAWGTLSVREVAQATWARQTALNAAEGSAIKGWRQSLHSFNGRLHWHCHFIQKLEDEPNIEFRNLHRAYDGLRPTSPDITRLEAWQNGETGLPFLDACMRCLRTTGWLNFRMRAMVMSTASYHLWLDWRAPGLHLARMFTDYEPGIHWSQVQMQSGTTGINTVRIYNPVKQGFDQDPSGAFTRRWVPELSSINDAHLHEPWTADNASDFLGKHYPYPIVDHLGAARAARDKVWGIRSGHNFKVVADAIQSKHGSRKSGMKNRGNRGKSRKDTAQLSLPLGGPDE